MEHMDFIPPNSYFISDLGRTVTATGAPGSPSGRYAVWRNAVDKGQLQLVEVGTDLGRLREKYRVPEARVGRVGV